MDPSQIYREMHADPCVSEVCSMCSMRASHKVAEDDSRNEGMFRTHPLTNYLCCEHFSEVMGVRCRP